MLDFHSKKIETCLRELKTSTDGLTRDEAEKRIKKYGQNRLAEEKPLSKLIILINQFKSPLIFVLLIAGFICLFLRDYIDMGVIFGSVFINTIIGYFQENKANQALAKLKKLVEHKTLVLRDGHEIEIDSGLITIGDIIIITAGNRIPADARLIEAVNLRLNEASLTGESIPSDKRVDLINKGVSLADRENMVYTGTTAVRGSGRAVVCAISGDTEIGQIAELVKATKEELTPLQERLVKFARMLAIIFLGISAFVFLVGILQGRGALEMFKTAVALAVASVPEGLTVAITVILVLGMKQILKHNALTRKLVAAETLGSTTVICTDKTGTLTEGKMHVAHIVIGKKEFEINNPGIRQDSAEAKIVSLAMQTAMMCNNAVIENPEDELDSWKILGAPTEAALLSAAIQSGLNRERFLKVEPRIQELQFTSESKLMITLHKKKNGKYALYEKGAPEKLLDKSTKFYHHGKISNITDSERNKLNTTYEQLTSKGLRVIGVAARDIDPSVYSKALIETPDKKEVNWAKIDQKLIFIGFIALKDPIRPGIKETLKICRQAGIRSVIITGDHQLTARAIAEEAGLKVKTSNITVGEKLDKISDKDLKELVKKIDIYARVNPHHKLRIVKALQSRGEVVAMTGDGINDAPALKAADIGLALGSGTDIAKETSDIILLDNNFKTIVAAVEQGRIIFSNIRKVITYLISDSFSEVVLIAGSILLGMPLAVLPAQILWINIVNDGLPDFSLAKESGDKNTMLNKPMKKNEPIMNSEMKIIIFGVGIVRDLFILGLFIWFYKIGTDIAYLRTMFFALLGAKSLISIFSLRSLQQPVWRINFLSNKYLIGAVSISFTLLLFAIYWGPLQLILSTMALSVETWMLIILFSLLNVAIIESVKHHFIINHKGI